MAGSQEINDFETALLNRLNKIAGKLPKVGFSTKYDTPLDEMITQLGQFHFDTQGRLEVDVQAIVADAVNIASPLYNGSVSVEDPRMNFTGGALQVDITALVADKVYIYGSDYGSPATNYQVKTDSSGQLYFGNFPTGFNVNNFPTVQPVSQSGTWNVGLNAGSNVIGKVDINSPLDANGYVQVDLITAIPAGSNLIGQVDAIQSGSWSVDAVQSGSWAVAVNNFPSNQDITITRSTLAESGFTGTTSATAGTYTQITTSSTICKSFTIYSSDTNTAAIFVGYNGNAARYIVPNGFATFSAEDNEQIDISTLYVKSAAASQGYVVNYEN